MSSGHGTKSNGTRAADDAVLFPPIMGPTEKLRSFVDDVFNTVSIQQDPAVLKVAIQEYMSPLFTVDSNGVFVSHNEWLKLIMEQRQTITELFVVDKKIIVVPADRKGLTGQVVHIANISGKEEGVGRFTAQCVGNYTVGLRSDGKMQIEDVNGIAAVTPVQDV